MPRARSRSPDCFPASTPSRSPLPASCPPFANVFTCSPAPVCGSTSPSTPSLKPSSSCLGTSLPPMQTTIGDGRCAPWPTVPSCASTMTLRSSWFKQAMTIRMANSRRASPSSLADAESVSSGGMDADFQVEQSIFGKGSSMPAKWSLNGGLGSSTNPNAVIRAAYSRDMLDGSNPEFAFSAKHFASFGPDQPAIQALALSVANTMTFGAVP